MRLLPLCRQDLFAIVAIVIGFCLTATSWAIPPDPYPDSEGRTNVTGICTEQAGYCYDGLCHDRGEPGLGNDMFTCGDVVYLSFERLQARPTGLYQGASGECFQYSRVYCAEMSVKNQPCPYGTEKCRYWIWISNSCEVP